MLECTNNLGNPCIPRIADEQTPRTSCLQNAQTVRIEGWAVNEAGAGERSEWTIDLNGCPPTPGINNTSAGDGEYTVGWTRPAGSNIWVESNGTLVGPFNDNQNPRTFSGVNGTAYTVQIWACNQFGCSTSNEQTLRPEAASPTISLTRAGGFIGQTCTTGASCRWVRGSGANWPPGEEYWISCGNPEFVNTESGFLWDEEGGSTIRDRWVTRRVGANGTLSWGDGICASNFSHPVTVWTSSGVSVTATAP